MTTTDEGTKKAKSLPLYEQLKQFTRKRHFGRRLQALVAPQQAHEQEPPHQSTTKATTKTQHDPLSSSPAGADCKKNSHEEDAIPPGSSRSISSLSTAESTTPDSKPSQRHANTPKSPDQLQVPPVTLPPTPLIQEQDPPLLVTKPMTTTNNNKKDTVPKQVSATMASASKSVALSVSKATSAASTRTRSSSSSAIGVSNRQSPKHSKTKQSQSHPNNQKGASPTNKHNLSDQSRHQNGGDDLIGSSVLATEVDETTLVGGNIATPKLSPAYSKASSTRTSTNSKTKNKKQSPSGKSTGSSSSKRKRTKAKEQDEPHKQPPEKKMKNSDNNLSTSTAMETGASDGSWICNTCTLENKPRARRCVVCESRKPILATPTAAAASSASTYPVKPCLDIPATEKPSASASSTADNQTTQEDNALEQPNAKSLPAGGTHPSGTSNNFVPETDKALVSKEVHNDGAKKRKVAEKGINENASKNKEASSSGHTSTRARKRQAKATTTTVSTIDQKLSGHSSKYSKKGEQGRDQGTESTKTRGKKVKIPSADTTTNRSIEPVKLKQLSKTSSSPIPTGEGAGALDDILASSSRKTNTCTATVRPQTLAGTPTQDAEPNSVGVAMTSQYQDEVQGHPPQNEVEFCTQPSCQQLRQQLTEYKDFCQQLQRHYIEKLRQYQEALLSEFQNQRDKDFLQFRQAQQHILQHQIRQLLLSPPLAIEVIDSSGRKKNANEALAIQSVTRADQKNEVSTSSSSKSTCAKNSPTSPASGPPNATSTIAPTTDELHRDTNVDLCEGNEETTQQDGLLPNSMEDGRCVLSPVPLMSTVCAGPAIATNCNESQKSTQQELCSQDLLQASQRKNASSLTLPSTKRLESTDTACQPPVNEPSFTARQQETLACNSTSSESRLNSRESEMADPKTAKEDARQVSHGNTGDITSPRATMGRTGPRVLPFANSTNRQRANDDSSANAPIKTSRKSDTWVSNAPTRSFLKEMAPYSTRNSSKSKNPYAPNEQQQGDAGTWVSTKRRSAPPASSKRQDPQKSEACAGLWADLGSSTGRVATQKQQPSDGANSYKYEEVVRCKAERQGLPCRDCVDCRAFYDVLRRSGDHLVNSQSTVQFSRHRTRFTPPETPEDFWEIDFIDEKRKKQQQQRIEEGAVRKSV
ncbi:hypothetical protein ACA910_009111 [Epithemia clementina (nom. ined.)]